MGAKFDTNNNNIQIRLFLNNAIASLQGKIEIAYGELNLSISDSVTIGLSNGITGENITFNNYTSTVGAVPGGTYYEYGVGYQYTNKLMLRIGKWGSPYGDVFEFYSADFVTSATVSKLSLNFYKKWDCHFL